MRIGELAGRLGLNPRTVRFYESIGVLPEPPRTPSGYRDYGEGDLERLRFVKLAQSLGLTLDDIREVLALRDRGQAPCAYVRRVIEEQAAAIDRRIEELRRMRAELGRLQRVARRLPEASPADGCVCHILQHGDAAPRPAGAAEGLLPRAPRRGRAPAGGAGKRSWLREGREDGKEEGAWPGRGWQPSGRGSGWWGTPGPSAWGT